MNDNTVNLIINNDTVNDDRKGSTPLQKAVEKNCKECLEVLLSYGAEVNIKNNVRSTNNLK